MSKRTIVRIGVVSGAAALSLAMAGPALACTVPMDRSGSTSHVVSSGYAHHVMLTSASDSLAAVIARADRRIGGELHRLTKFAAKVAADTNLVAPQPSDMSADIAAATAALQAQKAEIDAATSVAEVSTDLQSALVASALAVVTLDKAIVQADDTVAAQQAKLTKFKAKVMADTSLTPTEQASVSAAILALQTALTTEQAMINVATSTAEVATDLKSPAVKAGYQAIGLSLAIARADNKILAAQAKLTAFAAKIATDMTLSTTQQQDVLTTIMAAQAALSAEEVAVNAATSRTDIATDLKSPEVKAAYDAIALSLAIARADNEIAAVQAKLATWLTQVESDPNLSSTQQGALEGKITAEQAKLTALQTQVDSATSAGAVSALLKAAKFSSKPWNCLDPSKQHTAASVASSTTQSAVVKDAANNHVHHPATHSQNKRHAASGCYGDHGKSSHSYH